MSTTRRGFLKLGAAGLAGMTLLPGTRAVADVVSEAANARPTGEAPKRVIFLVSDGMSQGVPSLAENLSLLMRQRGTHFAELLRRSDVAHGLFETYSLNSLVTDSAAASTAWGSGSRVRNGAINVLPDGTTLRPVLALLKEMGYGTGLATTATVTHATPAGFAAVSERRGDEGLIAPQYKDVVDVVLGGGNSFFNADKRDDKRDVYGEYAAAGYAVARNAVELTGAKGADKILGIFSDSHVPYTLDHMASAELWRELPTLAEMTKASLDLLDRNPNGFLLQVEGARVDHAAHANDAAGMLWDQIAFDDAVGVALEYAANHPGTLVIVTSDHGNSNPGLNGMTTSSSGGYGASTEHFERLTHSKVSVEQFERLLRASDDFSANALRDLVRENFGCELKPSEADIIRAAWRREGTPILATQHQSFVGALGQSLGNYTGIGWCGTTHTEDYCLIAAVGPGQEHFNSLIRNTDFYDIMGRFFGYTHRNASMTPEQMKQIAQLPPAFDVREEHWKA